MTCANCGASVEVPRGADAARYAEEEAARCARLREIGAQLGSLDAARTQAGFAGVTETMDRVAHRASMDRLDLALKAEAERLRREMGHEGAGNKD